MFNAKDKRRRPAHVHPYLSGNFAPIHSTRALTPCIYTGNIPKEFAGGQYVRNGGNPLTNEDLGRDAHWFDGDGMLSGVLFARKGEKETEIQPEFVNQYILTDVYLASKSSPYLRTPILPSIATLVNPLSSLATIILRIFRTLLLVLLSHLPGSQQAIKKISVANTAILYHDGRALATCESGPPIRVSLPCLETVGWFNGKRAEGEYAGEAGSGFGGDGALSWMNEWTTGHPRVDPVTSELISFHSTFAPPYIHYSVVPATQNRLSKTSLLDAPRLLNVPVPGIPSAKMMHDFGVSSHHTIIMDLPLSLDPLNLAKNIPVMAYDPTSRSRFGVFPRYRPDQVRWFESNPCCIFHTANTWDTMELDPSIGRKIPMVNLLACRLTSASIVFSAGDIAAPTPVKAVPAEYREDEQCRLYYYQFPMEELANDKTSVFPKNNIQQQWALSAIPFEFPTLRDSSAMGAAKFVYGCSVTGEGFGAALGRAVKISYLAKIDAETLVARGIQYPPQPIKGCVDKRTVDEVAASDDVNDPIKVFKLPEGWYAQESRFVPRQNGTSEDDGWLLSYVFDESQLDEKGECRPGAQSELWIIDAKEMREIVVRIRLPQRVPYGLHGSWFSEKEIYDQRPVEKIRTLKSVTTGSPGEKSKQTSTNTTSKWNSGSWRPWPRARRFLAQHLG